MFIIEKPMKIDLLKIVRRGIRPEHCYGCRNNFYNGHNPYGIIRCWSMESARLVRRKQIHIDDVPPWNWQPVVVVPDCYRKDRYVHVGPKQLC